MANARSKSDTFVWTDDEVGLLLIVTLDYKVSKLEENIDWESCQSKYADILEAFLKQYPSSGATGGKEFPHDKHSISKVQVSSKLKAIRGKYRKAVVSGRRNGHGRVVLIFYELCEEIWGGSTETQMMEAGNEAGDMQVTAEDSPASSPRSSTPASSVALDLNNSKEEPVSSNHTPETVKTRIDKLQAKLSSHRRERLKRRVCTDPAVQEDLQLKRRMVDLLEKSERQSAERLDKLIDNIATITNTIQDGFSLLRNLMSQPPNHAPSPQQ